MQQNAKIWRRSLRFVAIVAPLALLSDEGREINRTQRSGGDLGVLLESLRRWLPFHADVEGANATERRDLEEIFAFCCNRCAVGPPFTQR